VRVRCLGRVDVLLVLRLNLLHAALQAVRNCCEDVLPFLGINDQTQGEQESSEQERSAQERKRQERAYKRKMRKRRKDKSD
jgi:hypothetical protein